MHVDLWANLRVASCRLSPPSWVKNYTFSNELSNSNRWLLSSQQDANCTLCSKSNTFNVHLADQSKYSRRWQKQRTLCVFQPLFMRVFMSDLHYYVHSSLLNTDGEEGQTGNNKNCCEKQKFKNELLRSADKVERLCRKTTLQIRLMHITLETCEQFFISDMNRTSLRNNRQKKCTNGNKTH